MSAPIVAFVSVSAAFAPFAAFATFAAAADTAYISAALPSPLPLFLTPPPHHHCCLFVCHCQHCLNVSTVSSSPSQLPQKHCRRHCRAAASFSNVVTTTISSATVTAAFALTLTCWESCIVCYVAWRWGGHRSLPPFALLRTAHCARHAPVARGAVSGVPTGQTQRTAVCGLCPSSFKTSLFKYRFPTYVKREVDRRFVPPQRNPHSRARAKNIVKPPPTTTAKHLYRGAHRKRNSPSPPPPPNNK